VRGGARVAEAPRRALVGGVHRGPADTPPIEADAAPRVLVDARVHEEVGEEVRRPARRAELGEQHRAQAR
jgi:hypothetical protein